MAKNRNKLKPKQVDSGKRLSPPQPVLDPEALPPKFCLRGMRKGYSVEDCEKDERAAFASRFYELSRSTWKELRQMPRHGQGWETLARDAIKGDGIPTEI